MHQCSQDTCSTRIPPHALHVMGHMPTRHSHECLHVITNDHQASRSLHMTSIIHGVISRTTWIFINARIMATTHEHVLYHSHVVTSVTIMQRAMDTYNNATLSRTGAGNVVRDRFQLSGVHKLNLWFWSMRAPSCTCCWILWIQHLLLQQLPDAH